METNDFDLYLDHLASALGHADRVLGLKDYCTGLMMPLKRKSVEPLDWSSSSLERNFTLGYETGKAVVAQYGPTLDHHHHHRSRRKSGGGEMVELIA